MPEGWHVVAGTLSKEGDVDDLVTREQFGNFELELEWKIGKGGNSGIFYRATREYDHIYWSGPEYQLLDDANARRWPQQAHRRGVGLWAVRPSRRRGQAVRRVEQDAHHRQWQSRRALAERPRRSSNTTSAVPTGRRRWRRASSRSIRTTDWPRKATSAFRAITPAPWRCATSASANCHDPSASRADDVPGVLHLGRVVRHHGHLPRADTCISPIPRSVLPTARRRLVRWSRLSSSASSPIAGSQARSCWRRCTSSVPP